METPPQAANATARIVSISCAFESHDTAIMMITTERTTSAPV